MPYTNLELNSLAGRVNARFSDFNLQRSPQLPTRSSRKIIGIGASDKGFKNSLFEVTSPSQVKNEFGTQNELFDITSSIVSVNEEQYNLGLIRIGSKPYHWRLMKKISGSQEQEPLITIVPLNVEDAMMSKLGLILLPYKEGSTIRQRIIIQQTLDNNDIVTVYDSERILVEGGELLFEVENNVPLGEILFTPKVLETANDITGSRTNDILDAISKLKSFKTTDQLLLSASTITASNLLHSFNIYDTSAASATLSSTNYELDKIEGDIQSSLSHVERYAHLEQAYIELQDADAEFLYCEGCYADVEPVSLTEDDKDKVFNWQQRSLGYQWKYEYDGIPYSYMFARSNPFDSAHVASTYSTTDINGNTFALSVNHTTYGAVLGDLLNLVEITLHSVSAKAGVDMEIFPNHKGLIECHLTHDFTNAVGGINTPFAHIITSSTISNNQSLSFKLRSSKIGDTRVVSQHLLEVAEIDLDPFVNTHFDLVGESIPEAVIDKLVDYSSMAEVTAANLSDFNDLVTTATLKASNDEVRETSFMQQASQLAYQSSINYNTVVAVIPTTKPDSSSRGINRWAGNLPEYQIKDDGTVFVTKNGEGILGNKLLVGNTGYRDAEAFGGIYLTTGDDLPNQKPYGISYADEAINEEGKKIDLGKHLIISAGYGYINDLEGNQRFVNAAPKLCQMFAQLDPGTEPLGSVNGIVPGFRSVALRVTRDIVNRLADARITMLSRNNQILSLSTVAHPSSDYTNLSTIMSSNEIVRRIRGEASSILGNAYTDAEISNLNTRMLGLSRAFVNAGYAQACTIELTASRLDRINGVLNANVTFIPPFSIRAINVTIRLDAPAAV